MSDEIELPKSWGLSEQQDIVIGGLIDEAGNYVTAHQFCEAIYDEDIGSDPAPAKLRVLIQRCRAIINKVSDGGVEVEIKRNHGWKMTKRNAYKMNKIIAEAE